MRRLAAHRRTNPTDATPAMKVAPTERAKAIASP